MEYELNGVNLIVHLPGELDHHSVRTLPQDIELLFGEYEIRRIIFDFSAVTFMDSSGMGRFWDATSGCVSGTAISRYTA